MPGPDSAQDKLCCSGLADAGTLEYLRKRQVGDQTCLLYRSLISFLEQECMHQAIPE